MLASAVKVVKPATAFVKIANAAIVAKRQPVVVVTFASAVKVAKPATASVKIANAAIVAKSSDYLPWRINSTAFT